MGVYRLLQVVGCVYVWHVGVWAKLLPSRLSPVDMSAQPVGYTATKLRTLHHT